MPVSDCSVTLLAGPEVIVCESDTGRTAGVNEVPVGAPGLVLLWVERELVSGGVVIPSLLDGETAVKDGGTLSELPGVVVARLNRLAGGEVAVCCAVSTKSRRLSMLNGFV